MKKQTLVFTLIVFTTLLLSASIVFLSLNNYDSTDENKPTQITPTPSPTPAEPVVIDVIVTHWGDMFRTKPDCKEDFSVELTHPNQNENFTTNKIEIIINAGAYKWIVEKAFFTSDLFSGERWIPISKNQYTMDLQKTFTFNLFNVPKGQHELTLIVIFHEGTRNQTTSCFNVLT